MTISASRGTQLSIDDLILTAYQQSGIVALHEGFTSPQWTDRVIFARRRLDAIIDELATSGGVARSTDFYNLTLAHGVYRYDLPSYALHVSGDGMFIDPSVLDITKADSETLVQQVSRETWHSISAKSAVGTPSIMYCHRASSPPQIWFWPIPSAGGTVRLQLYRLSADTYEGDKTVDLMDYWVEYITYRLAFALAVSQSLPAETCGMLRNESEKLLRRARMLSNDHTDNQIYVCR